MYSAEWHFQVTFAKEDIFSTSACWFACAQDNAKTTGWISIKLGISMGNGHHHNIAQR